MVRTEWPRDNIQRQWHERPLPDGILDDGRYAEPQDARRQPPLAIEKALREHCGIKARHYFVAAILDDGSEQTFSGPGIHTPNVAKQIFSWSGFHREIRKAEANMMSGEDADLQYGQDPYRQHYGSNYSSGERTRRTSEIYNEEEMAFRPRKRNRFRRPGNDEDDVPAVTTGDRTGLQIGDKEAVWKFYDQRFRNCQQTACKLIAKAWVKAIEPKKQTHHPYTGKEAKAPSWWPTPWGSTKEDKVRHKEPDHLYKRERVYLLCHILRVVVQPLEVQKQKWPSVAKLGLNVTKLKEATDEALSSFFSTEGDRASQKNSQKKPFLDEIFKIARLEERFLNGEIDADTQAWIMSDKPESTQYQTDEGGVGDEADHPSGPTSASPRTMTGHEGILHGSSSEQSPTSQTHLQGGGFMGDMVGRGGAQYPGAPMTGTTAHMLPQGDQFIDDMNFKMSGGLFQVNNQRRSSMYTPTGEYTNPPSAGLYNQQTWPMGSTAPSTAATYAFQQQQQPPSQGHFSQAAVPMNQGQYMHGGYDGALPRSTMDQGTIYRSTTATNQGTYPGYMHTADGRTLPNPPIKQDVLSRVPGE
ncbi:hypothetical protein B0T11DRAFT_301665 [Plectosphaerella cucumerina]|uniref:Subtelomeric hrmA-associated cluster protein AFUB-079030/YDR124W-like helical bundle domain-containing protein n=1 Tax=Plectosphaerella cucumerina TaxID=40658 RepID=A0A8K0TBF8_9PEZI|nr:hypothetical protein B0T11DRAFT_301665 [Plectosphaerella cucumerina]